MKPLQTHILPQIFNQLKTHFPRRRQRQIYGQAQPHNYHYQLDFFALIGSFLMAYVLRLSGGKELLDRYSERLNITSQSDLSNTLSRGVATRYVETMTEQLAAPLDQAKPGELVVLDSMPVTLARTQRHQMSKFNNKTVGGGVLWALRLDSEPGQCPLTPLCTIQGSWHDSKLIRKVKLVARGPIYLMDQGFYALAVLKDWVERGVRYLLRVREKELQFEVLQVHSAPRLLSSGLWLKLDATVRLGAESAKAHPVVRLVWAVPPKGKDVILATSEQSWSAEQVLATYKRRWEIEQFHRLLKDVLGLAHLYSFADNGLAFQLHIIALLVMLLGLSNTTGGQTVKLLRALVHALRRQLGLGHVWKRNCCKTTRAGIKRRKQDKANPDYPLLQTIE